MSRLCTLGNHQAGPSPIRNQGFEFGRCRRCGRDLVRSRRAWRTVPKGFRVVWRRAGARPAGLAKRAAPFAARLPRKRRIAAAIELVLLGAQGLGGALADRLKSWAAAPAPPRPAAMPTWILAAP